MIDRRPGYVIYARRCSAQLEARQRRQSARETSGMGGPAERRASVTGLDWLEFDPAIELVACIVTAHSALVGRNMARVWRR